MKFKYDGRNQFRLLKKTKFLKVCFFRALFFIKRIFVKKDKQKCILLINFNNLGDLVCDTPSIRNIRKLYKNHKIIMLVRNESCKQFMQLYPYVDEIVEMPHSHEPLKQFAKFAFAFLKYKFDFSMQFVRPFHEYYRTYLPYIMNIKKRYGLIQIGYKKIYNRAFNYKIYLDNTTTRTEESLSLLKFDNIPIDNEKTECFIDKSKVKKYDFKNYIVIQTCATIQSRMWHKNRFIELINKITLNINDLTILLTGVKAEEEYINSIKNSCNNKDKVFTICDVNISTLLSIIQHSKVVITNDTGPFHFARAFNIPTIVIFGISPPEYLIKEKSSNCIYFRGTEDCKDNCNVKSEDCKKIYKHSNSKNCCINNITVTEVYNAFLKILKRYQVDYTKLHID